MTAPQTPNDTTDKAEAGSRNTLVRGAILVVALFAIILAWPFLNGRAPSSQQQMEAFVAADPELVAIGGTGAPVITADDVTPRFYSISDMASPAEIRMAVTPLFDARQPAHVWIFADKSWADGTHGADLVLLVDDLQARGVTTTLILPPQSGETADETIDGFARLANDKQITFIDYHDAAKLGPALCPATDATGNVAPDDTDIGNAVETYHTQQMLLHMAINAPDLRPQLRLADIGARIERLKAETVCPGTAAEAESEAAEPLPEQVDLDAPAPAAAPEAETKAEAETETAPPAE